MRRKAIEVRIKNNVDNKRNATYNLHIVKLLMSEKLKMSENGLVIEKGVPPPPARGDRSIKLEVGDCVVTSGYRSPEARAILSTAARLGWRMRQKTDKLTGECRIWRME